MTERGVIAGGLAAFMALCAVAIWLHAPAQRARGTAASLAESPSTVSAAPAAADGLATPSASTPSRSTPSAVGTSSSPTTVLAKPTSTPSQAASSPSVSPSAAQSTPKATASASARPTSTPTPTATLVAVQKTSPSVAAASPSDAKSDAKKVEQDIAKQLTRKVIEFESLSDKLTDNGKATLNSLLPLLAQDPTSHFEIGGHTDSWGEQEFNQALSERRARTVRAYLVSKGVNGERLTARGYGDSKPIANNKTSSGSRKNRRIEFTAQ